MFRKENHVSRVNSILFVVKSPFLAVKSQLLFPKIHVCSWSICYFALLLKRGPPKYIKASINPSHIKVKSANWLVSVVLGAFPLTDPFRWFLGLRSPLDLLVSIKNDLWLSLQNRRFQMTYPHGLIWLLLDLLCFAMERPAITIWYFL